MIEATKNRQPTGAAVVFTRITSTKPKRLTKVFGLRNGLLTKQSAANMTEGQADRRRIAGLQSLEDFLEALEPNQAIAWGVTELAKVRITTADRIQGDQAAVARIREHFSFREQPGILMLDHDGVPNGALDADELRDRLIEACPELSAAPMLWRPSASSGIRTADGLPLTNTGKHRLYIPVADASQIPSAGKRLLNLLWAAGHGWCEVGNAGQALERCLVDGSVWQPERLDFAACPILQDGLVRASGEYKIYGNADALFDLSLIRIDDAAEKLAARNRKTARTSVREKCATKRSEWASEYASSLAKERMIAVEQAHSVLLRASEHQVLMGDFILVSENGSRVSVGEILDDPDRWHQTKFADPLGDYPDDQRIATAILKSGMRPALRSFGHGGQTFELRRQSARIQVGKGRRIETTDSTLAVLRERGELFDFGEGSIAYVADGRARTVGADWLADHMGRAVEYFSVKNVFDRERTRMIATEEHPEDAPHRVALAILAKNGERGFKKLIAVITAPTLRVDGSILDTPGYDPASQLLYYTESDNALRVPADPTVEDAIAALRFLWQPFAKFPFVDDVARGVMLHAILTACVRASLPTAPGTGFDAPAAGTGKTLLARCVGVLATGNDPSILPPADTEEETRKRLFAALREGSRVLLLDNVREPLGGGALDAFLTASYFTDRVLGESATASLPNRTVFLVTGNNLRMTGDTFRRILVARLDAQVEQAYVREFDFDPVQRLMAERVRFVVCALTIVRAWIVAGRQRISKGKIASFEVWDELVRQPLCWLQSIIKSKNDIYELPSFTDPMKATETAFEQDPETAKLSALLVAWHQSLGNEPTTVAKVVELANSENGNLYDAIEEIASTQNSINRRVLGRWIERHAGQILGGLKIVRTGDAHNGVALWAVRAMDNRVRENPEKPNKPAKF